MKNKPRILYIATFPPPVHGSSMVSEQIKNSQFINDAFDGDYINISTSRSMNEIGKKGIFQKILKLSRYIKSFLHAFWLLLVNRYDLCYCAITINSACFLRDATYVLLCKLFGHKIVIHQHNVGMSKMVDKLIYRTLYPLVYKNVKVILLSWELYPDIERVVKKEQVMICPNGIKQSVSIELLEVKKLNANDIPRILFLSNLLISKGVFVLLDALKILKDKGYSFVCDFVGGETKDVDSLRFQREVESRNLEGVAVYYGRKYGNEKNEFWKRADIFAFPSLNEAFGLVAVEAMEYGIPVVASNEGGIPEIIKDGENGLLVEKGNPMSLSLAIEKLILDKETRLKMGECGRKKFEEKFTEERFERKMRECLENCIKKF